MCRCPMRPIWKNWRCRASTKSSRRPRPLPTGAEPMDELPVPPGAETATEATEILRAFIVDGGLQVALIPAFDEPDVWGVLLSDIARHAARAFAEDGDMTEAEAISAIYRMFEAELN